ncbi:MAG: tRNA epoxyqueuosine(34) reductase QueG [Calditrichaeota bacterium]|nr:MAG: tRNA epoxyqueuosine(34) reductase QueG [Calditrichota bacterium]
MSNDEIKSFALSLGFFRVGIAQAEKLDGRYLDEWLQRGYHGEMSWMHTRRDLRLDPAQLFPNARSIIVCAMNYFTADEQKGDSSTAFISRYARGEDYHLVLKARLKKLLSYIQQRESQTKGRVFVDSAPILEKEWAVRAGIGWRGKHSNIITRSHGSWFFLGELIIDRELDIDQSFPKDYCGACTACIDACPTRAIIEPRVVDARRCISFLTIERKSEQSPPPELAQKMGNHIFGCDICQEVCPWNQKFSQQTDEQPFHSRIGLPELALERLISMNENEFAQRFQFSPIKRCGYDRFIRNIRTALQNYRQKNSAGKIMLT